MGKSNAAMVSALAAGPEGGRSALTVAMDTRLHHQRHPETD
jgi:hypothetical protein